ncbi:MAG: right-handed parallel beta-helix repeat-containing protein [Planctomycetaceae bacterium]|nr:right-handed parallel beta-helix repeat-containing protein [Planctomycetaceae bacterium]
MLINSWLKSLQSHRPIAPKGRRQRPGRAPAPPRSIEMLESRQLLTTFTVNSLADTADANPGDGIAADANGETSLRAAIEEANLLAGSDTIAFNDGSLPGVNFHDATPDVITLSGSPLSISSDVVINGPAADLLSISGGGTSRVIAIGTAASVTIDALSVIDGQSNNGGGINSSGDLTLRNVSVHNNRARGIQNGGSGSLTVINSTVRDNFDAGIRSFGDVLVINSTVSENDGNGIRQSGTSGNVKIVNSTVVSNATNGVNNQNSGPLEIVNSIVAGNGIQLFGSIDVNLNNIIRNNENGVVERLQDNGGPTRTHALVPGSAAINGGDDALALDENGAPLTSDQLGNTRFLRTVDIGAVEYREADSLVVTTDADIVDPTDSLTSLREAVAFANSNPDVSDITFGNGTALAGGTDFTDAAADVITLGGTQLDVNSDVSVSGPAAQLLTISGNDQSRVFRVGSGDVLFSDLTVANGSTNGDGAGILVTTAADVTLDRVVLSDNTAGTFEEGGAIRNNGRLTVSDSYFVGNESRRGGGIFNRSSLVISGSTFADNTADTFGGAVFNEGTLTVVNSTLSGNQARSGGGGLFNLGGATVINSTITGNTSSSGQGGGLRNSGINGTLTVQNSIVVGNTANTGNNTAGGLTPASGSNLTSGIAADVLDPVLSDNGGTTLTHALASGSAAINAGNDTLALNADGAALVTDQRGAARIVGTVDIGAVEASAATLATPLADLTVDEDAADLVIDLSTTFADTSVAVSGVSSDAPGLVSAVLSGTELTLSFAADQSGSATITVTATDSAVTTAESFVVTVTPVNDAPTVQTGLSNVEVEEGVADVAIDLLPVFADIDDPTLTYSATSSSTAVVADVSGSTLTLSFPTDGTAIVTVTATDAAGASVSTEFEVTVNNVPDPGVEVIDGKLIITGTDGDDEVLIQRFWGSYFVFTSIEGAQFTRVHVSDVQEICVDGADGDDVIVMGWFVFAPTTLSGGAGNDIIVGGWGNDTIDGGAGDDCLHGSFGDDTLHGGDGDDWIDADAGNDIVYAGAGDDRVWGGRGNDILLGQSGDDLLFGGRGLDLLIGGDGSDQLFGRSRQDIIITGDTNVDDDEDSLRLIRDIWTGGGSTDSRIEAIEATQLEVLHDDDVDEVWGGSGRDWLLFDDELDLVH